MTDDGAAPIVGVVGGSRSDYPTLETAMAILEELGSRPSSGSCRRIARRTGCSGTRRRRPAAGSR